MIVAQFDITVSNFVAGDDLTIDRTVVGVPSGTTIARAWFSVKRKYSDTTTLIQKIITTALSSGNGIIVGNALAFYIVPAETVVLKPLSEYKYDIQLQLNTGIIATLETGTIVSFPQVTI